MTTFRGWLGVVVAVALGGCVAGEPLRSEGKPIVNGSPTTGSPATVFLWLGGGSCSGTLITPKVVLTAKHCLQGTSASQIEVMFGSNADSNSGTWINVVHRAYHSSGDIGILTLAQPGPTTPVPYWDGDLGAHAGEPVHIVGFGVTSENGSDSGLKREGMTKLDRVEGDIMYTGVDLSGSWTCYGDSGGPNYMTIGGKEYVVGATSFGTSVCGQPEDGAVRTDTYKDWIADYIAQHDPADCGADARCADGCPSPDPDCVCASDGECNVACVGWETNDADCAGCGAGDACRADCPELDVDCCATDGACNEACGAAMDEDCVEEPPPPPPDDGTDGTDPGDENGDPAGACSASGGAGGGGGAAGLGVMIGLALLAGRPRRRRGRNP